MTRPGPAEEHVSPKRLERNESLPYARRRRGTAVRIALPALAAGVVLLASLPGGTARAGAERPGWPVLAQTTTPNPDPNRSQSDEGGDEEEDQDTVPIPPNLLEPDTTGVFAPPDTVAPGDTLGATADSLGRAVSDSTTIVPVNPALSETIRYVPPGDVAAGKAPAPNLVPVAPKKRAGVFGLGPAVVLLSLAVLHFFVIKAVK